MGSLRASMVILSLILLALPTILWMTSTMVLVFHLENFPGGSVFINGQTFHIGSGNGYSLRILHIDRDSGMGLACPPGAAAGPDTKGYFTGHMQTLVVASISQCEIRSLQAFDLLPPRVIRLD